MTLSNDSLDSTPVEELVVAGYKRPRLKRRKQLAWLGAVSIASLFLLVNLTLSKGVDWSLHFIVPLLLFGAFVPLFKQYAPRKGVVRVGQIFAISLILYLLFLDYYSDKTFFWSIFPSLALIILSILVPVVKRLFF